MTKMLIFNFFILKICTTFTAGYGCIPPYRYNEYEISPFRHILPTPHATRYRKAPNVGDFSISTFGLLLLTA